MELSLNNQESEELHSLRKQYLEKRLQQIAHHERKQPIQDEFTTRMYGKQDYTEEKKEYYARALTSQAVSLEQSSIF